MSLNSAIQSRLVTCSRCGLMFREPRNCMGYEISKSKGCKLLECQQRALALCFVVMEAGISLLDMFGKNIAPFLLVAVLLSAFILAFNLYVSIKDRTKTQAERQKEMDETLGFLMLLVVETLFHSEASVVRAIFNVKVFVYSGFQEKKEDVKLDFLVLCIKIATKVGLWIADVPPVKPQTIDSKPSTSNPIDLEPLNSLTMRRNAGTDVEQANRQVNDHDIPSHNIEKENDNIDYYMSYITHIFNSTEEYVDMLPEEELDKQPETEEDKKNGGGGGGDDNNGDGDGDGDGGGDGNDGSSGGKNEKKDNSDGNGNNDKGEDSGCGSGNNGNMKRKQNKPMFGCKFGYHAGNQNLCPSGQLLCV